MTVAASVVNRPYLLSSLLRKWLLGTEIGWQPSNTLTANIILTVVRVRTKNVPRWLVGGVTTTATRLNKSRYQEKCYMKGLVTEKPEPIQVEWRVMDPAVKVGRQRSPALWSQRPLRSLECYRSQKKLSGHKRSQ